MASIAIFYKSLHYNSSGEVLTAEINYQSSTTTLAAPQHLTKIILCLKRKSVRVTACYVICKQYCSHARTMTQWTPKVETAPTPEQISHAKRKDFETEVEGDKGHTI